MPPDDREFEQISQVLDWLAGDPADECADDLGGLVRVLDVLPSLSRTDADDAPLLPLLAGRTIDVAERLKPLLLTATLPLPQALRTAATDLVRVLLDIATLYRGRAVGSLGDAATGSDRLADGMKLVAEAYVLSCMSGIEVRGGFWRLAYDLYRSAAAAFKSGVEADDASSDAISRFGRVVAVSALQPEGLTAREVTWVFDYLDAIPEPVEISDKWMYPDNAVFWIDPASDMAPVAQVRRAPEAGQALLYFRALVLSQRIADLTDWLDARIADAEVVGLERDVGLLEPDVSGVPLGLTPVEVLSLLRRMRERWATPPSREHTRRRQSYTVQVCQGLKAIWSMSQGETAEFAEWRVSNESPGGYAIISVKGVEGVLSAGMALALRREPSQPWSVCVVRWIRNDRPDEVELGLQVVAQACAAASIAFRGGDARSTTPALVLPPMLPARRNQAILAAAGTYTSRRFVMVRDGRQGIYVVQGRVLSLDMQTANVEIFQYEPDPYPI